MKRKANSEEIKPAKKPATLFDSVASWFSCDTKEEEKPKPKKDEIFFEEYVVLVKKGAKTKVAIPAASISHMIEGEDDSGPITTLFLKDQKKSVVELRGAFLDEIKNKCWLN